jgi:putative ABC transport system ATP-binding protein
VWMDPLVKLDNVEKSFKVGSEIVQAVKGISLEIKQGTLVILRGRSGSGKTTTLNMIGGLDLPTKGKVLFRGQDVSELNDAQLTQWRRKEVGFVFQSFALMPVLTAWENVELAMRIAGFKPAERTRRVRECLEMVGLLKRSGHRVHEMSGGEQQRVSIARAIANQPSLILADEPTGALDHDTGLKVMGLLKDIVQREGLTIIVCTHDPAVMEFGDETFTMVDGQLAQGA